MLTTPLLGTGLNLDEPGVEDRTIRSSGEPGAGTGITAIGAIMVIELAVPEDWTPGQALAMRQLLQQALRTAQPVVTSVRKDVTAEQLKDVYDRIEALIRETGLQAA